MSFEQGKLVMDGLHKVMKMQTNFVFKGQGVEEQIHEPGFSTANATP